MPLASSDSGIVRPLALNRGVELDALALRGMAAQALTHRLTSLVAAHRIVLLRRQDLDPRLQLSLTAALGRAVGRQHDATGSRVIPELRVESRRPGEGEPASNEDPYSVHWHSDLSWSPMPADYVLLQALEADAGCARTRLADTSAAYERLSPDRRRDIASWRAFHHVALSRERRYEPAEANPPAGAKMPVRAAEKRRRMLRRLWPWRRTEASRAGIGASLPEQAGPGGALHRVVQHDAASDRHYVYLGDHAWRLQGRPEDEGLALIDALNEEITHGDHVYCHDWQPGDLLLFDNRMLLHSRGTPERPEARRTLRRTLAWRVAP